MVDVAHQSRPWSDHTGTARASDGTRLAFASGGPANARAIVCANGVGVSTFFWDYVGTHFVRDHRIVVWDYPGHGFSGIPENPGSITMQDVADSLARVMDANAVDRAVLLGHSMGCQVVFEFYRLFPDRVLALVPMLGAFSHPADTFLDPRVGRFLFEGAYRVGTRIPEVLSLIMRATVRRSFAWHFARFTGLIHPDLAPREDMEPYLEHLSTIDVRTFFEIVRAAQEHDASDLLDRIAVPTLVVAAERDLFTPRHLSLEMARRIPRAELLDIPRGSHAALIEQPELINLRLEKFLRTRLP